MTKSAGSPSSPYRAGCTRSVLTAGLVVASAGALTVAPPSLPGTPAVLAPAVRLTAAADAVAPIVCCANPSVDPPVAALTSAGSVIINAYNYLEPWVAYGFELADWALSFVPGVWWLAPAIDLAYFTGEPIVQSLVYSFAYLIDGDFAAIGPAIRAGIEESASNFVYFGIAWVNSLVPLPPTPPFPSWAGSAVKAPAMALTRSAGAAAAASADAQPAPQSPETEAPDPAQPQPGLEPAVQAPRPAGRAAATGLSRRTSSPAPAPSPSAATQAPADTAPTADPTARSALGSGAAKAAAARSGR